VAPRHPPFELDARRAPVRAVRAVALAQLDYARLELERGDADGIHEARKACKKLRALLRLIRPFLGRAYRAENLRLRDVGRSLSAGRDATVIVETAQRLYADATGPLRAVPAALGAAPQGGVSIEEARRLLATERHRIAEWRLANLSAGGLLVGLLAGYRTARARYRDTRRRATPAALHEWRKQAKYHGYQCALIAPLWPGAAGARIRRLKQLSDALGWHHDLVVLAGALRRRGALPGDRDTLWLARRAIAVAQADAVKRALALGKTLFDDKPLAWLSHHAVAE